MERGFATHAQVLQAVAEARARNDFAAIDAALAEVVDRAAAGDQRELAFLLEVIDQHRLALGAVRKMLIDEGDVHDALQHTLMAVHKSIGTFERRSRFTTWLYRIAEREPLAGAGWRGCEYRHAAGRSG